jgi:hypothetical protein
VKPSAPPSRRRKKRKRTTISGTPLVLREAVTRLPNHDRTQSSLLECARELAEISDVGDAILGSVVTRARTLLDCDYTYLSLIDSERGETSFYRATSAAAQRGSSSFGGTWRTVEMFVPCTLTDTERVTYIETQVRAIAHDGGEFFHGIVVRRSERHTISWMRCTVAYLSGPPGLLD